MSDEELFAALASIEGLSGDQPPEPPVPAAEEVSAPAPAPAEEASSFPAWLLPEDHWLVRAASEGLREAGIEK